jgi:hypothetical protein
VFGNVADEFHVFEPFDQLPFPVRLGEAVEIGAAMMACSGRVSVC